MNNAMTNSRSIVRRYWKNNFTLNLVLEVLFPGKFSAGCKKLTSSMRLEKISNGAEHCILCYG